RVRLPDEPARPALRRLVREAGALSQAGLRDRAEEPADPDDAVVPAPGRARARWLAVRPPDHPRREEARLLGVRFAASLAARGRARRRRRRGARPRSAEGPARGRPRPSWRGAPGRAPARRGAARAPRPTRARPGTRRRRRARRPAPRPPASRRPDAPRRA